eukprot:6489575-Amphidinium_carterae.1
MTITQEMIRETNQMRRNVIISGICESFQGGLAQAVIQAQRAFEAGNAGQKHQIQDTSSLSDNSTRTVKTATKAIEHKGVSPNWSDK